MCCGLCYLCVRLRNVAVAVLPCGVQERLLPSVIWNYAVEWDGSLYPRGKEFDEMIQHEDEKKSTFMEPVISTSNRKEK